jgi:hypothetical protein
MNFKLKSLVAAAVLAVAAIPAQAAMENGLVNGNGSMVLTAIDFGSGIAASFDLGLNYNDFSGNSNFTSQTWNLTTGDYAQAWNDFSAASVLANVRWFVAGNDSAGAGVGARGFVQTSGTGAITNVTTSQVITQANLYDEFYATANLLGNHSVVADGANTSTNLIQGAGRLATSLRINNVGSVVAGSLDQTLSLMQVTTGATPLANATQTIFADSTFSLTSNGTLIYAAVPEADTSAMLFAGLGLMGFIARRRTKA